MLFWHLIQICVLFLNGLYINHFILAAALQRELSLEMFLRLFSSKRRAAAVKTGPDKGIIPSRLPWHRRASSAFSCLGIAACFKPDLDHFLLHRRQIGCFSSRLLLCHSSSEILQFRAANLLWKCS